MLKILYFAHLREQLGRECDDLVLPDGVANVAELIEFLKMQILSSMTSLNQPQNFSSNQPSSCLKGF